MASALQRTTSQITENDWTFAVHEVGRGHPVVLMHGLLTNSRVWAPVTDALAGSHRTLAVDAPGHGASPRRPIGFTLEDEVDALIAWADRAVAEPAVWIGHSMGGMKAMRIALARPDLVRGLVLVSTQPYAEPDRTRHPFEAMVETVRTDGMSAALADVVARMNFARSFRDDGLARGWIEHFRSIDGEEISGACHAVYRRGDISSRLPEIFAPTLVVHGRDDVPIRLAVAQEWATLLPHGRLVELPGVGHTPPCERPNELATVISRWLGSLD
jgi:3-oxoadipate enol-lactonase